MELIFDPAKTTMSEAWVRNSWYSMQMASISAMKEAAFYLKGKMREAVEDNRFNWPELRMYTKPQSAFIPARKTARRWKKGAKNMGAGKEKRLYNRITDVIYHHPPVHGGARTARAKGVIGQLLGNLATVFRYVVMDDINNPRAHIGIIKKYTSQKAVDMFTRFQRGGDVAGSNESMSKYWGALGMPKRKSTMPKQPARPLVAPIMKAEAGAVAEIMQRRFAQKMDQLNGVGVQSLRKPWPIEKKIEAQRTRNLKKQQEYFAAMDRQRVAMDKYIAKNINAEATRTGFSGGGVM